MEFLKHFPRLVAAVLFAASASTAVVVSDAARAGAPATGIAAVAAAQPAAADELSIGIGVGPNRYPRYAWRNNSWVRFGYYNGYAPGYIPGGYYVGWGAPRYGWSHPQYGYRGYYNNHAFDARRPYNPGLGGYRGNEGFRRNGGGYRR
jgi:hypothetical protein